MGGKTEQVTGKRTLTEGQEEAANNSKKQKKNESNTIPILRGKFKQRWLVKHSSLIKRSDDVTGIMVSCNVNAETRALVSKQTFNMKFIAQKRILINGLLGSSFSLFGKIH
jgi:hypothetical protein